MYVCIYVFIVLYVDEHVSTDVFMMYLCMYEYMYSSAGMCKSGKMCINVYIYFYTYLCECMYV